ncbi:hypothetical protein C8Q79DRAFT_929513 [Trametes meyenii]|nr:hypothetical protein C8Q79DRAFT_929513 [Trametes meyenii]
MQLAGGLSISKDSGVPEGLDNYTTLVVIHGYVWHSGVFCKLMPLASPKSVRIILLNRREYPGAVPYTPDERALLPPVPDCPRSNVGEIRSAAESLKTFMRQRAHELYNSLQDLVEKCKIPSTSSSPSETGGIVLVGWSLGAIWMTALLNHVADFPLGRVNLSDYIKKVILSDPPACLLGYRLPEDDPYNPFFDTSLTYEERGSVFTNWVTSYFAHDDIPDKLERRSAIRTTLSTMTGSDFAATVHIPPGAPGGSDWALLHGCVSLGICETLRKGALSLSEDGRKPDGTAVIGDEWRRVEVRYVWGDHSIWEVPYGAHALRLEIANAKRDGRQIRSTTTLCIRGANHFAPWDYPERTLHAFLVNDEDKSDD